MKLIIGLGNPGKQYEQTRHNVGFMFIDYLAEYYNVSFEVKKKYHIANFMIAGEKVFLLKPQTFMNLSGEALIEVMNFYKIDIEDIIVICDDLDMSFGKLRAKFDSSSGGHNGLKNIINHLHSQKFTRIKVGINNEFKRDVKSFVLSKFSKDELILLNELYYKIHQGTILFIKGDSLVNIQGEFNK